MAVFRITSRTWNRHAAKATIKYIAYAHRRQEEPTGKPRQLFGRDGEPLTKAQAYRMIDKARGNTTFFRIALSPDRKGEDNNRDLDLSALTDITMMQLQHLFPNQTIPYIAAIHTNTDNRHVHILAMVPVTRIPKKDLSLLIRTATQEALAQRRLLDRDIGPSPVRSLQPRSALPGHYPRQAASVPASKSRFSGRTLKRANTVMPARRGPSCPNCGPSQEMERYGRRFECLSCGLRLKRTGLGIEITKGPDLELSLEGVGET
jgi:ribosomal protein S27AE